jgi:hypothetical protein
MVPMGLIDRVAADVWQHCRQSKGYEDAPYVNPLVPVDCVSALMMARLLIERRIFDHYVSVAPEGHVYGYFFEQLGQSILSVYVDYPPRSFAALDDLSPVRDGRVLILEDDVVSGITLRLVTRALLEHQPRSLSLYLGRLKEHQVLENVCPEIEAVYLAEDHLDPRRREEYEAEFIRFFART